MKFQDLPDEKRRQLITKLLFLISHLECALDIVDELTFHPSVYRFNYKRTSNAFRDAAGQILKEVLYDFKHEHFTDENGNRVTNTDDIQLESFKITERVKLMNRETIDAMVAELNEA